MADSEGMEDKSMSLKKKDKSDKKPFGLAYDGDDDMSNMSGSDAERGPKHNPKATTFFVSAASEGDVTLARGDFKKATVAYGRALELHSQLEPTQRDGMIRAVLVARSKCWNQLGMPEAALLDADRALLLWEQEKKKSPDSDCMKDYYKGLLAKAEALYSATDFEHALVYYHRGDKLRHEQKDFRLGIQKCQQAIKNSIGDPSMHHLTLEFEEHFNKELKERQDRKSRWKMRLLHEIKLYNDGSELDFNVEVANEPQSNKVSPGFGHQRNSTGPIPSPLDGARGGRGFPDTRQYPTYGNQEPQPLTQKQKVAELRRVHGTSEKANSRSKKANKQLLGSLQEDEEFLKQLLMHKDFKGVLESDAVITDAVEGGLKFLDSRKEFWRQQKPLYARQREEQERLQSARTNYRAGTSRQSQRLPPMYSVGSKTDRGPPRSRRNVKNRPRSASRIVGADKKKGTTKSARSREEYFEATRYAIQTLENVNNALEYGNPELGLTLAKNFLARIGSLDLADKPRILGNLYCSMGNTYLELNKPTLAAIHHRKDLDIAETYKFNDATMRALGNLGRTYRRMGDFKQSIGFFERQAGMAETAEEAGRAHLDIARCHFEGTCYADAREACTAALELANEADDGKCLLRGNLLLAQTLHLMKLYSEAVPYYEAHVRAAEQAGLPIADSTMEELELVRRLANEEEKDAGVDDRNDSALVVR